LLYATHSARFWFFYVDAASTMLLQTKWSTDFVTWTPGASLTLASSSANEGRNFSVAYADLGGKDVVHVAFSHFVSGNEDAYHARATIDGGAIAFAPEVLMSSGTPPDAKANPDGCVTAIGSDGFVYAATGW